MTCEILTAIGSVTEDCRCANCNARGATHLVNIPSGHATHSLYCAGCCEVHRVQVEPLTGPVRETRGEQDSLFSEEAL